MDASEARSELVLELADKFLARCRNGERPSLREYIERNPELAAEIREVFPAMAMMENIAVADDSLDDEAPAVAIRLKSTVEQMGDFRIIREIGHGGMGVVYEAEQVSLGRHVALKLLPNHAVHNEKHKRRFAREAKAAAKLHHTNIVPVFGVGEHEGVPYYVMQFIQGLGLDAVLDELNRLQPDAVSLPTSGGSFARSRTAVRDVSAADVARSLMTGTFAATSDLEADPNAPRQPRLDATAAHDENSRTEANGVQSARSDAGRLSDSFNLSSSSITLAASSGAGRRAANRKLTYWQSVANIGRQAAEALEYAHKQGVLHRDVKPSNLLLDLRGTVWVADFGLAKFTGIEAEDLTHTGDLIGTLRYMPPESFEGKSDARSDVYALGLTLYELIAMRPAFDERDRNRLIKQVTTGEPTPLDKVRAGVPRDLVTIVQKAIEREPSRRYATAEELAADLQRFLDDEPIQARRQTQLERCVRWARHHPGIASLAGVLAGVLVAVTAASLVAAGYFHRLRMNEASAAEKEREARGDAMQARNATALQAAGLVFDRAIEEARTGEPSRALHLFVRALQTLPPDDPQAVPLERAIRLNLTAWAETAPALEHIWPGTTHGPMYTLSSDGELAALAINHTEVQIFRTSHGRPTRAPVKFADGVGKITFAPDGKSLWVSSELAGSGEAKSETIRRIDVNSGAILGPTISTRTGPVTQMLATPDGRRLVASVNSLHPKDTGPAPNSTRARRWRIGSIVVWDAASGDVVRQVPINSENALSYLGLSLDGRTVNYWANRDSLPTYERAKLSKDAAIRMELPYDGLTFRIDGTEPPVPLGRLPWREEDVYGFAFIPGMQRGLASQDGVIHRWSIASRDRLESGVSSTLRQLSSPTPDGRSVVSKTDGRVFDVGAWPPRHTGVRFAHPAWSAGWSHVECTTDGRFTATGVGGRFQTRLWRMPRPLSRPALPEAERNRQPSKHGTYDWAEFDANGEHAVLYVWGNNTRKRHIQIVDFPSGQVRQPAGHDGVHVLDVAFTPDGRHFAVGDRNGQARVWDAATGRPAGPPLQHSNWVAGVAFSPDGGTLAASDYGPAGVVKLWDWRNGKETRAPLQHDDIILGVAFSPDGRRLATFTADDWSKAPKVRQWDLDSGTMTGQAPFPYPMHFQIGQTPYRPDGQVLMARDDNGLLCIWDVPTCRVRAQRRLDGRGVSRFSPNGAVVAAAELRGVRLLDGDTLAPLPGGLLSFALDQVHDLTFSPNGGYLLTGHESGSAQLWDVAARKPIGPPTVMIGPIRGVAFSADGKTCRCVANDGSSRSWAVPTPFEESNLERLRDQVALMTGLRLDDAQGLDFIDAEEWKSLRYSLVGDGSTALFPPRADADWHNARALDAEQDGDAFGADWHLDRLAKFRPSDWMIEARRGRVLASAGRRDEAAAAYRKARELAKNPQALADWLRVAASHDEASDRKATALWALDLAVELAPGDWTLYAMRARWSEKTRALADLDEAVRRGADEAVVLQAANLAAEAGDWKRSSTWWNRVAKARVLPMQLRYLQALANLKAGDQGAYRIICSDIAKHFKSSDARPSISDINNAAMVFALGPNATDDWKQPIGWIDQALTRIDAAEKADPAAKETIRRMRHTFLNTRGAVLYRAGRFADAAKTLREGMAIQPDGGVFHDWLFLALAEQRLGHAKAAGEAAAKARSMKGATESDSVWEKAEVDSLVAELDIALPHEPANGGTKK